MLERTHNTHRLRDSAGGGGDFFAAPDGPETVTVSNGPYGENYPVAGMTVAQIRARLRDRLDIDPLSQAIVDGRDVDEDTVVLHGQALLFAHRASEKGTITIDKNTVTVTSPEGTEKTMKLSDFLRALAPERIDTGDFALPMGTRSFRTRGRFGILIHETHPRVCNFKWIDEESPAPYGAEAKYRTARISLPYVLVFAVFEQSRRGTFKLSEINECFFSNQPLESMEQQLYYPALLNCSRYERPAGRPLSWICTQHLRRRRGPKGAKRNELLHTELNALLQTLFETGFNYSSEHHEMESWFTASRKSDKRIASVKAWEKATDEDAFCGVEISWLPTNLSAEQIMERIFENVGAAAQPIRSTDDLARLVFNSGNGADEPPQSAVQSLLHLLRQHSSSV